MTVLLVLSSEDDGGLARVGAMLAEGLPRHGIHVAVALQRAGRIGPALAARGIPVHIVPELIETLDRRPDGRRSKAAAPRNVAGLPRAVRALRALARRHDASVLYGHGSWPNHLVAEATRGWGHRAPGAVWHIHTAFSRINHLAARVMLRRGHIRAVIGVSRAVAGPYNGRGAPVHVVYNGVPLDACDRARAAPALRDRLGIARDAFIVGYAGRLVAHKGIDVLVDAAAPILRARADAHMVVLGGAPASAGSDLFGALRRRFDEVGPGDRIHLPGFVEDVLPSVADFDVALVPSIYADPCPLAVFEALALGVPVVASRIGGIPELIDDGRTGILVPPGDAAALAQAAIDLSGQIDRRRQMAAAAQASAHQRFDATRMVGEVAGILSGVMGS